MSNIECERGTLNRLEQYFFIDNDRGWTAVRKKKGSNRNSVTNWAEKHFQKKAASNDKSFGGPKEGSFWKYGEDVMAWLES